MSVYEPNSRHLWEVLIFCFNMKKSAAEAHRMLSNTYGETAISERTCRSGFNASRKKTPEGLELANVAKLVGNSVAKNDAKLVLSPRFRQVLIESPLSVSFRRKISQRLPELESLREKKGFVSYEDLTINGTNYTTFQEAARGAGLPISGDFIDEELDDAASVMNLTEEKLQK
ncbi:mariner Mos1 transposase [Trichonephila clavipes]|nr:mariner Mos1 transposase [Trichonephila clavipes]